MPDEKILENLNQVIERYQIDVIHSHFGYLHRFLLVNHRKLQRRVGLIFHDHMDFSENGSLHRQKLGAARQALLARVYDAYIISVMQKKDRAYWLAGKKRHYYVPNGLSLRRAEQDTRTSEELREELGVKPQEKLALFLGWDLHGKGLDVAVKAVSKYRETSPDLKLGVIGAGRGKPNDRTQRFLLEVGCDPEDDWIIYMNDYEDMFALDRSIDIYLSASRRDAFSYGVLEAVSQNTPVVVSDIEGTSWSWEYDKCVTFRNGDADSCAEALRKAIAMGRRESNCQEIVDKYSNRIWCERIIRIYKDILEK